MKTIIGGMLTAFIVCCVGNFLWSRGHASAPLPDVREPLKIRIQPLGNIGDGKVSYVYREIKKVYDNISVLKAVGLPRQAYYKPRNRYRADTIIAWLARQTPDNCVTIGLTASDISTDKDKIVDWGVMGLGYQPGKACVVSTFRLDKSNLLDQFFKVSIHELGHTQGLPHCSVKTCYMRDAEGHNSTNEETGFCPKCRRLLEEKGWRF